MLRIALRQSLLLSRFRQRLVTPALLRAVPSSLPARFESNGGGVGSVKERQEYLQADWVAPKLSYEEVKRRTQEPTEVWPCYTHWPVHTT